MITIKLLIKYRIKTDCVYDVNACSPLPQVEKDPERLEEDYFAVAITLASFRRILRNVYRFESRYAERSIGRERVVTADYIDRIVKYLIPIII